MALLDVNALVALAWDSHIHHAAMRAVVHRATAASGWATCPITESGFVRVSSNPEGTSHRDRRRRRPRGSGGAPRRLDGHRFLADDVSIVDPDVPGIAGYRQVTDAHLLTLARRSGMHLVTFDGGIPANCADGRDIELLTAL